MYDCRTCYTGSAGITSEYYSAIITKNSEENVINFSSPRLQVKGQTYYTRHMLITNDISCYF